MKFVFINRLNGDDKNSGKRGKPIRTLKQMLTVIKTRFPKKRYPVLVVIGQQRP